MDGAGGIVLVAAVATKTRKHEKRRFNAEHTELAESAESSERLVRRRKPPLGGGAIELDPENTSAKRFVGFTCDFRDPIRSRLAGSAGRLATPAPAVSASSVSSVVKFSAV